MSSSVISHQNDTIADICWRHFGRSSSIVERVLDENPHLAHYDVFLPAGIEIKLPNIEQQQIQTQSINLWD